MFTYCNNNSVNLVDFCGSIPRELALTSYAMCTDGGGGSFSSNSVPIASVKVSTQKAEQLLAAVLTNLEFSVGIGLGLYGETNALDFFGLGVGIQYNLIEVKVEDGDFSFQQSYNEGLSASVLFMDVLQNLNEGGSRKLTFASPMGEFIPDGYNKNWTILGGGAYFFMRGSVYLGFDMISFCEDIDAIFFKTG